MFNRLMIPLIFVFLSTSAYSISIEQRDITAAAQNATAAALVYGLPLIAYAIYANSIINRTGSLTTNSIFHETTLANSSYHTIVLPNVDTLYSEAVMDLSEGDVVATMPPMTAGRFYVWPFYDMYGNNFCNIGTATNSTAGKYLITFRTSDPGCTSGDGDYAGLIYMPTVYGIAHLRIEADDADDVNHIVSSIQPCFSLSSLSYGSPPRAPVLTPALLNGNLSIGVTPLYILQLVARFAEHNPPEVAADVASATATLEAAGISIADHTYTTPPGVNLTLAWEVAQDIVRSVASDPSNFPSLGENWTNVAPALCGDFQTHYAMRALISLTGYLQLQATQAIYPRFGLDMVLTANQTYMIEFSGKPQVTGFWSLTMYDAEGFLVPNSLDRYSLNNRGTLTYPDGTLVYGGGSPADSVEPFYMLLQSTDAAVSEEWTSNWLPTPAEGAEFQFFLRWYGPTTSLVDGTYTYPKLTAVASNPTLPN
ncbi:hypothetical protein C8R43DRAFT_1139679 [Mycena crocata]|nr:hypothetical protein C8R43DRAFT_1139679 [Mycena crocata]